MTNTTGMTGMTGMTGITMVSSEAEYLAQMIPHHEEAVTAARELARSERRRMRELGASIVAGQTAEIEEMRQWLHRWHPGTTTVDDYRPTMPDLSALGGDTLDEAFLVHMIPHHMTAVMMSQQLLLRDVAGHADVAQFAAQVRDDQRAEIRAMRRLLHELPRTAAGWSVPRRPMGMGGPFGR